MKIVVFGGSFNPIHVGHAIMASTVAAMPDVDEVWMMVSPQNPFKVNSHLMPEDFRLKLARLAMQDCEGVKVSDFEFHLERPSYTYKTLKALQSKYPEHSFRILIGSDNWQLFHNWRDADKIISEFGIVIYQRPDCKVEGPFPKNVRLLENVPLVMLSSTYIREKLGNGESIDFLVPEKIKKELWKMK